MIFPSWDEAWVPGSTEQCQWGRSAPAGNWVSRSYLPYRFKQIYSAVWHPGCYQLLGSTSSQLSSSLLEWVFFLCKGSYWVGCKPGDLAFLFPRFPLLCFVLGLPKTMSGCCRRCLCSVECLLLLVHCGIEVLLGSFVLVSWSSLNKWLMSFKWFVGKEAFMGKLDD